MFRVETTAKARRELKNIPRRYQKAIDQAFQELAEDPRAGKPLTGDLSFRFSYRVGVYRIIYLVNKQEKIVKILTAGHRGKVYR